MKRCLARLLCLALCLVMLPLFALAENAYIINDSNTRTLTHDELWKWDYESLGYILNEIFARHGYVFIEGSKYDTYFKTMPWYSPVYSKDNEACYAALNKTEWANQQLIKDVRAEMREKHTTNPNGRSLWATYFAGFSTLSGFTYVSGAAPDQTMPVYSAPNRNSWRGANGKASVSTNGNIYAAGWENNWLLIMYETNNGSVRVGYVHQGDMTKRLNAAGTLNFANQPATLLADQALTDDPARNYSSICTLPAGTRVSYLATFYNHMAWDYVEAIVNNQLMRGFIRSGNLDIPDAVEAGE